MEWSGVRWEAGKPNKLKLMMSSFNFFVYQGKSMLSEAKFHPMEKLFMLTQRKIVITDNLNDFWLCQEQDSEGSWARKVNFVIISLDVSTKIYGLFESFCWTWCSQTKIFDQKGSKKAEIWDQNQAQMIAFWAQL